VDAVSERLDTVVVRIKHGTTTGYSLGCRCADCKAVQSTYMTAYRQRPEVKAKHRVVATASYQRLRRLAHLAVEAGLDTTEGVVATASYQRLRRLAHLAVEAGLDTTEGEK
jgi:tRNA A37 threonylcarbamoyladenosine synthetase subunit TsaC/SUA5/YrdC